MGLRYPRCRFDSCREHNKKKSTLLAEGALLFIFRTQSSSVGDPEAALLVAPREAYD